MAARVRKFTLGIDVSKDTLEVYCWDDPRRRTLPNEPAAVAKLLKSFSTPGRIALEPTASYHLELIEQAHRAQWEIFLINPRQLVHYRKAVGERNKTDAADAYLLARYLVREGQQLQPFAPPSREAQQLWALIKRRAHVVGLKQQLRQSLAALLPVRGACRALEQLIERIDVRILKLIDQLGWRAHYQRCQTIPGIGHVNAAALTAAFHRGAFASTDAFVAYLGLDVRLRESGRYKGKRKLTKLGEPQLRRLLWCAGQPAATSYPPFARYLHAQLEKGLSKTAAKLILARKLARIAFAMLRDSTDFRRQTAEA